MRNSPSLQHSHYSAHLSVQMTREPGNHLGPAQLHSPMMLSLSDWVSSCFVLNVVVMQSTRHSIVVIAVGHSNAAAMALSVDAAVAVG
jgi:hypothetical protein